MYSYQYSLEENFLKTQAKIITHTFVLLITKQTKDNKELKFMFIMN